VKALLYVIKKARLDKTGFYGYLWIPNQVGNNKLFTFRLSSM